jgi:mannosyltransferase OCH1-like enzyme
MIPKIVHQSYPTRKLPPEIKDNIKKMKKLNPGWEFKVYNDKDQEDFILKNYGTYTLEMYNKINPLYGAARADFFRYLLLYIEGGVWLDIKSTMTKPLDDLLLPEDEYILSNWNSDWPEHWGNHPEYKIYPTREYTHLVELQQFFIISKKKHPFLKAVIDQVLENIKNYRYKKGGVGRKGTLRLTGPIMYTSVIYPLKPLYKYRQVSIEDDFGFKYSIYDKEGDHLKLFKVHYSEVRESLIK